MTDVDHRQVTAMRRTGELPRPWPWRVIRRGSAWTAAAVVLGAGLSWDFARRRRSASHVGRRLRALYERVGGIAVKLGQQLSLRADLLPQAMCDELATSPTGSRRSLRTTCAG